MLVSIAIMQFVARQRRWTGPDLLSIPQPFQFAQSVALILAHCFQRLGCQSRPRGCR
jgi:hypothetical protein